MSSATVRLSTTESVAINNALNEVRYGVRELSSDGEFGARLGVSRDEARRLLADTAALIERMPRLTEV